MIADDVVVAVLVVELCSRVFRCIFKSDGQFIRATFPFTQMVCWVRYSSATRGVSESSFFLKTWKGEIGDGEFGQILQNPKDGSSI